MKKELVVKYIVGDANQQERLLVDNWAAEHSDNRRELEEMKKVWNIGKSSGQVPEIDIDRAWLDFVGRRNERINNIRPLVAPRKSRRVNGLRIAVALFVFCLFGFWILRSIWSVEQSLETGEQVQHVGLPDGSTVHLNTHAEMVYQKSWLRKDRRVQLRRGAIFFDVKRDHKHPFIVESGTSKIKVLGTSFQVRREGANTEVIVASGAVKVIHDGQEIILKPDQMVVVSDTLKNTVRVDTVPDQLYRYYVHEEFMFENTTLERVFDVLGKAYDKQFLIEDPEIKKLTYNATFEQQSLQEILEVIVKTFGLTIQQKDNVYYIN